jgi:hypothetical protein
MAQDKMKFNDAKLLVAKTVIGARNPGLGGNRRELNDTDWKRRYLHDSKSVYNEDQSFEWEQAWGVHCNLRVKWNEGEKRLYGKTLKVSKLTCEVSWSGTGRDLSQARAAVALYSQVVDLGCLLESHMDGHAVEPAREAWERSHSEMLEARKLEIRYGTIFELNFKKRKSHAHGGKYETPDIHWDLLPEAVQQAEGNTVLCGQCKNKARVMVWHSPEKGLLLRCNRHRDQVPPPPSLEGIAPDPCKKESDDA